MPPERIIIPRFIGGTNMLVSRQMSDERTVNFFPETTGGGGKTPQGLRPSEGIRPYAVFDSSDTSALFAQDGRAWSATGTVFGEIINGGSTVPWGTLAYDPAERATIASNGSAGHQIAVVSGGTFYIFDTTTNAFGAVGFFASNSITVKMVEFMDGYFFALEADSRRVYYSALEDGTSWNTLNYIERSWGSDNIQAIKRAGRQLWLVGSRTSEVWADSGNATNPFAPVQGVFLDTGAIAPFSVQRDGESLMWLSQDERGAGQVIRANGYSPQPVTTYSVASMIQSVFDIPNDISTAEAFVHQRDGHVFYWLHVEGLDTTPVLDLTENVWAERAHWVPEQGIWIPHTARCHCFAFGTHLVGARANGVIYALSDRYRDDYIVT